jgi:Plasmid replication region DNA-binding N-term
MYMSASTEGSNRYGSLPRGITASDVRQAADTLLRSGERPTIEKIRLKIGKGSPNTINPLLDAWWKTLSARLDAGPAALHRLPESVAHVAEALWMQALEEGRRRAHAELKTSERLAETKDQALEIRSQVLTLREGELDSRLRDRERTIDELNLRLRELTLLLRKEQTTREFLSRQIAELQSARLKKPVLRQHPRPLPRHRNAKLRKRSAVKRPKPRTRR